jgi:hypothetical protein
MLLSDVKEWIEAERAVWHAVVRKEYGSTVFHYTACGRNETAGLVLSKPRRVCAKCRRALKLWPKGIPPCPTSPFTP